MPSKKVIPLTAGQRATADKLREIAQVIADRPELIATPDQREATRDQQRADRTRKLREEWIRQFAGLGLDDLKKLQVMVADEIQKREQESPTGTTSRRAPHRPPTQDSVKAEARAMHELLATRAGLSSDEADTIIAARFSVSKRTVQRYRSAKNPPTGEK